MITAITGGIGSGKSIVSKIVSALGHEVYDTDSNAKRIMDSNDAIKHRIATEIDAGCINADGSINRPELSRIVFYERSKLTLLNNIVHGAVKEDILSVAVRHRNGRFFIETAILYESGLDKLVDEVWVVTAPEELRIERVMKRNNLTKAQVIARIEAQSRVYDGTPHPKTVVLTNNGLQPLLPQLEKII